MTKKRKLIKLALVAAVAAGLWLIVWKMPVPASKVPEAIALSDITRSLTTYSNSVTLAAPGEAPEFLLVCSPEDDLGAVHDCKIEKGKTLDDVVVNFFLRQQREDRRQWDADWQAAWQKWCKDNSSPQAERDFSGKI
jgi:hypothetical protein